MLEAIFAAGIIAISPLEFRAETMIDIDDVTLGSVADIQNLPVELRKDAEQLKLYRLAKGQRETRLGHAQLASRARALFPALSPWLSGKFEGAVRVGRVARPVPQLVADCSSGVSKGDDVTAVMDAGWFRVERKVEALQQGGQGSAFFARTSDGEVAKIFCKEDN